MKKILLTIGGVALFAISSFSQGSVAVYSTSSTFAIYTNTSVYNSSLNGVYNTTGGKTTTTANAFYYALLVQTYNAGNTSINPLDGNYSVGMMATNYILAGSIRGVGAASGAPVSGWGAPTGSTYDTASEDNFLLVGWSASLGTTWSQVSAQLNSGTWLSSGFFGVSALGYGYSGGGPNTLSAPSIFGSSTGMPGGLSGGITLYAVPVPEPGTIALATLGGLSMLALRRRKA